MAFSDSDIKELVDTYPDLCGETPTSFMAKNWKEDFVWKHLEEVCHADMKYLGLGQFGPDELITAVPETDFASIAYICALLACPFQRWKEYIELCKFEGSYYLHIKDLNCIPAKVVYNLCIASRAPIEFPHVIKRFNDMIVGLVHPGVALCASARELSHNRMDSLMAPYSGHWWFQPDHDWRAIILGNPEIEDCPSFADDPSASTPCNPIWGVGDKDVLQSYTELDVNELDKQLRKELNLQ